jgi:tetratricopeptide (TPR) repeat protein
VLAGYPNHELLPDAVKVVAEGYYLQALADKKQQRSDDRIRHFQNAIRTYQIITEQLPPTAQTTPEAHYFIACAYRKMEHYADAIAHYRAVAEYWPHWERASKAQYRIARCWERLGITRQIPMLDASREVVCACEQLTAKYPECAITNSALPYAEYWRDIKARYEGEEK